jgi:hypothetical protein
MCSHPKRVQSFIDWEKEFAKKRKEWEATLKKPEKAPHQDPEKRNDKL